MIYVECTPDTTLARTLAAGNEVVHLHGSAAVCGKLQHQEHCKGMADGRDVLGKHPYVQGLQKWGSVSQLSTSGLLVLGEAPRDNTLILLQPRLEEWVIHAAKLSKIDPAKYGLSDGAERLHDQLTLGNDEATLNKFRLMIQSLLKVSDRVQDLAQLLRA